MSFVRTVRALRWPALRFISTTSDASREAFVARSGEGLTYLILNRAQAKNALSMRLIREMGEALDEIRFDGSTRVLILRSATLNAFCAGADLKERRTMDQTQVSRFLYDMRVTMSKLQDLPMPTVAAIDGPALGGGLELALCCDLRVANRTIANIGLVETRLAIIPGAGGTVRATRLLGSAKAKDLIFSARVLNAEQAHAIGLVDYLADEGASAVEKAEAWAKEVLPNGPIAVRAAKQAIDAGSQLDMCAQIPATLTFAVNRLSTLNVNVISPRLRPRTDSKASRRLLRSGSRYMLDDEHVMQKFEAMYNQA